MGPIILSLELLSLSLPQLLPRESRDKFPIGLPLQNPQVRVGLPESQGPLEGDLGLWGELLWLPLRLSTSPPSLKSSTALPSGCPDPDSPLPATAQPGRGRGTACTGVCIQLLLATALAAPGAEPGGQAPPSPSSPAILMPRLGERRETWECSQVRPKTHLFNLSLQD